MAEEGTLPQNLQEDDPDEALFVPEMIDDDLGDAGAPGVAEQGVTYWTTGERPR